MNTACLLAMAATAVVIGTAPGAAHAEDIIVVGHVYAADGKEPLSDATVAVYDDKNQVIDHAKTDANGMYTLHVSRNSLHFPSHHHGGNALGGLIKGVGKIMGAAASIAVPLAGLANPLAGAGVSIAEGALGSLGGPRHMPGSQKGSGTMASGGMDQARAQILVRQMQAHGMAVPPQMLAIANGIAVDTEMLPPNAPGALPVRITLPGGVDAAGVTQIYCLQEQIDHTNGKNTHTVTAWVDPVQLAGPEEPKRCSVPHTFFKLVQAQIEPSIAEYGQTAQLSVKMVTPGEPIVPVIVIAHDVRTGKDYELTSTGDSMYRAEIMVDKEFAKNEHKFCILAYAQNPDKYGRSKRTEDILRGKGMWDVSKPYDFDPAVSLSRNRVEASLTVVEARK